MGAPILDELRGDHLERALAVAQGTRPFVRPIVDEAAMLDPQLALVAVHPAVPVVGVVIAERAVAHDETSSLVVQGGPVLVVGVAVCDDQAIEHRVVAHPVGRDHVEAVVGQSALIVGVVVAGEIARQDGGEAANVPEVGVHGGRSGKAAQDCDAVDQAESRRPVAWRHSDALVGAVLPLSHANLISGRCHRQRILQVLEGGGPGCAIPLSGDHVARVDVHIGAVHVDGSPQHRTRKARKDNT